MIKIYDIGEVSHYLAGNDIIKFKNFIKVVKDHDKEKFIVKSPSSDAVVNFWYRDYEDSEVLFGSRYIGEGTSHLYSFRIDIYEFEDRIKLAFTGGIGELNAVIKDGDCYLEDKFDFFKILNKATGIEIYKTVKEFNYYD